MYKKWKNTLSKEHQDLFAQLYKSEAIKNLADIWIDTLSKMSVADVFINYAYKSLLKDKELSNFLNSVYHDLAPDMKTDVLKILPSMYLLSTGMKIEDSCEKPYVEYISKMLSGEITNEETRRKAEALIGETYNEKHDLFRNVKKSGSAPLGMTIIGEKLMAGLERTILNLKENNSLLLLNNVSKFKKQWIENQISKKDLSFYEIEQKWGNFTNQNLVNDETYQAVLYNHFFKQFKKIRKQYNMVEAMEEVIDLLERGHKYIYLYPIAKMYWEKLDNVEKEKFVIKSYERIENLNKQMEMCGESIFLELEKQSIVNEQGGDELDISCELERSIAYYFPTLELLNNINSVFKNYRDGNNDVLTVRDIESIFSRISNAIEKDEATSTIGYMDYNMDQQKVLKITFIVENNNYTEDCYERLVKKIFMKIAKNEKDEITPNFLMNLLEEMMMKKELKNKMGDTLSAIPAAKTLKF